MRKHLEDTRELTGGERDYGGPSGLVAGLAGPTCHPLGVIFSTVVSNSYLIPKSIFSHYKSLRGMIVV
jgi:hypothetical protein